jgi:hypothetical protein
MDRQPEKADQEQRKTAIAEASSLDGKGARLDPVDVEPSQRGFKAKKRKTDDDDSEAPRKRSVVRDHALL